MRHRKQNASSLIKQFLVVTCCISLFVHLEPVTPEIYWIRIICAVIAAANSFALALSFLELLRNLLLRWYALRPTQNYGSAQWAKEKELKRAKLFKTNGLFLGVSANSGRPLFFDGETHGLTLSPAGGGKTTSFVIPALLHERDMSMIVPDLKGTLACVTKYAREKKT